MRGELFSRSVLFPFFHAEVFFSGVLVGKSEKLPSQMKDDIIASELQTPV